MTLAPLVVFITGANGAGKTTTASLLERALPQFPTFDLDDSPVPRRDPTVWRQRSTEYCVGAALAQLHATECAIVVGHAIPGEILAAPSAIELPRLAICLLDCDDPVRYHRLLQRGREKPTQDVFNWAAWQRLHAIDPQWRQDIIMRGAWSQSEWSRWKDWERCDPRWRVWRLDSSNQQPEDTAKALQQWIAALLEDRASSDVLRMDQRWWDSLAT